VNACVPEFSQVWVADQLEAMSDLSLSPP
jgi:hypothetical protein